MKDILILVRYLAQKITIVDQRAGAISLKAAFKEGEITTKGSSLQFIAFEDSSNINHDTDVDVLDFAETHA